MFKFWPTASKDWLSLLPKRYRKYTRPREALGMTTDFELCMLETYAQAGYAGQGRIVDLGCWFGATTLSLARGLKANRRPLPRRTIDAIDMFLWESWMDPIAKLIGLPRSYREGDCFYDDVKELLRPYGTLVNLQQQDLLGGSPLSEPVEFLFIDAMKNWPLAKAIAHGFFPALMPDLSYVVQQDFTYFSSVCATNALLMWWLRDHFEWVHHVPYSHSVVFRCRKNLEAKHLPEFVPERFSLEMIDAAYKYSLDCVSADQQVMVQLAKFGLLIELGQAEAALALARQLNGERGRIEARMLMELERSIAQRRRAQAALNPGPETWLNELEAWVVSVRSRN